MEKWLQQVVNDFGLEIASRLVFLCTPQELQAAIDGDRALVYELGVKRNSQAKANLAALKREGYGHRPSGRPAEALSDSEASSLLSQIRSAGVGRFCETHEVTEASLAKAILGRPVAVHTAAKLRKLVVT